MKLTVKNEQFNTYKFESFRIEKTNYSHKRIIISLKIQYFLFKNKIT